MLLAQQLETALTLLSKIKVFAGPSICRSLAQEEIEDFGFGLRLARKTQPSLYCPWKQTRNIDCSVFILKEILHQESMPCEAVFISFDKRLILDRVDTSPTKSALQRDFETLPA